MPSHVDTAIKMSPSVTCYDILPGIANICALEGWGGFVLIILRYITTGEKKATQSIDHTMGQMTGD
jgi:hypothetical protein